MKKFLLLLLLLVPPGLVFASSNDKPMKRAAETDWLVENGFAGFLQKHPDILNHRVGSVAYHRGDFDKAIKRFRRAARYADKPSQAMISGMFWDGRGVEQDRARAYAWADLAAEREYPEFARLREGMWATLGEEERREALRIGKELYAEFGDEVAQPRIASVLRRARNEVTGSRIGAQVSSVRLFAVQPRASSTDDIMTETSMDASHYYAANYWQPEHYFKWREVRWREEYKRKQNPNVDVGELRSAPARPN